MLFLQAHDMSCLGQLMLLGPFVFCALSSCGALANQPPMAGEVTFSRESTQTCQVCCGSKGRIWTQTTETTQKTRALTKSLGSTIHWLVNFKNNNKKKKTDFAFSLINSTLKCSQKRSRHTSLLFFPSPGICISSSKAFFHYLWIRSGLLITYDLKTQRGELSCSSSAFSSLVLIAQEFASREAIVPSTDLLKKYHNIKTFPVYCFNFWSTRLGISFSNDE